MNTDLDQTGQDHTGRDGAERPVRPKGRRNAAIGVTAGLLGGGAVGLLMTMPSMTSAATDDTGSSDVAVVALQDDSDAGTETDSVRPEPGERLRETLQPLVDDGTITAAQAEAVSDHLVQNRPERGRDGHGPGHRGAAFDGEVVADLIGIDVDQLREALRGGASIADIAAENGADTDAIVQALVDELEGHLELAVEDGRLTDTEAAERLAQAEERITARINGERPGRG